MAESGASAKLRRIRRQFPALARVNGNGDPVIYSDAPGGTQVPVPVIRAMYGYMEKGAANLDSFFATSAETGALVERAKWAAGLFCNGASDNIVFGANMTSLTFALSRAIARTWQQGDEIIVSSLDHDTNITPWVLMAEERGCLVRTLDFTPDQNLAVADLQRLLTHKTRLVAFTLASNATGSITPARDLIKATHDAGSLVYLDAVHYAAHRLPDVQALDADFLVCSAYKFCGPYLGLLYGRPELLGSIKPYKVRPAKDNLITTNRTS